MIKNKLNFVFKFICIFMLMNFTLAHAITFTRAPQPPQFLYRVDDRDPNEVFSNGFLPWMQPDAPQASNSLWWHIQGNAVRDRRTSWVSTSGTLSAAEYTLRDLARQRPGFPTTTWVYEVAAGAQSYSAVWALQDAIATMNDLPPSARDNRRIQAYFNYLMAYQRQDEWATRGGHSYVTISRAVQWSVSDGVWRQTGVVRNNPNYRLTFVPPPQDDNPLIGQLTPVITAPDVLGYETDTVVEVDDLGHQYLGASFLAAALSCIGMPPPSQRSIGLAAEPTCDTTRITTVAVPAATYPSKLAIVTHDQKKWCLNPKLSAAYTSFEGYSMYLQVDTCTEDASNKATMDRLGRITYYTRGINFCATAPTSVINGQQRWDWINLLPCDIHNPNQRWSLYKGKMYLGNTKMYIQDWNYYAILSSDNSGYDNSLDVSRMDKNFFEKTSAPQDYQTEIKMGWVWQGTVYYPTDAPIQPWSTIYSNKTYYDEVSGRVMLLARQVKAFQPVNTPQLKCLVSKQYSSGATWDWANWEDCNQRDAKSAAYSFYFSENDKSKSISGKTVRVSGFDYKDEMLWSTGTGQNAGAFFTSTYDYSTKATKVFEISSKPYLGK